jgi:hypothetical protein
MSAYRISLETMVKSLIIAIREGQKGLENHKLKFIDG